MKLSSRTRLRVWRKFAVLVAMAPMFQQLGWCGTGVGRTMTNVLNDAPGTYSSALQSVGLLPLQLLVSGGNFFFGNFVGGGI